MSNGHRQDRFGHAARGAGAGLMLMLAQCSSPAPQAAPPEEDVARQQPKEKSHPQREAERKAEQAAAVQKMLDHYLLHRGYFRHVTDEEEKKTVIPDLQRRLRETGIPAMVSTCEYMGVIATGTAKGSRAYGGVCTMRIAGRRATTFLVCDDNLGGVSLVEPVVLGLSLDDIEIYLRRICF